MTEPASGRSRGRFLVLDGIDGCGKSTQAELLVERLAAENRRPPLHVREPGSSPAGERIRSVLLDPKLEMGPATETLLLAAARRQMLDELVEPALQAGRDVVCERFHPSTFAYQAVAGGVDEMALLELLETWASDPSPDLIVLLDLDEDEAAVRRRERVEPDRIEGRGPAFHRRVAAGYRQFAERADNVIVVSASGAPDEVARRIWEEVVGARR